MLDLHRLRLLRELKHRGTLAAVAAALSYSPSTISAQLAQLEREAGVPLLVPAGRRVRLTPEAETLVGHVEAVLDVISKGAAGSWQMENRGKTMNQGKFDFGFAVDWMRKDLGILLDEARRNGAKLPVSALVDQFYAEVQAMGGNRWDTSSLVARLER